MWGDKFENVTALPQVDIAPYLLFALYLFGGVASRKDGVEKTLDLLDISDKLINRSFGEGGETGSYMPGQIGLAKSILKRAECIKTPEDSSERGSWELTSKGTELAEQLNENLEDAKIVEDLRSKLVKVRKERDKANKKAKEKKPSQVEESVKDDDPDIDEDELAELAMEEDKQKSIRAAVEAVYSNLNDTQFEQICVQLLNKIGKKWTITPRSHDGGIDARGVVEVELIIFEVVVQCKRYDKNNKIPPRYINELHGSMANVGADKAIFMTTSSYSKKAIEAAQKHSIRLIDGEELVELLRKHGLI